LQKASFNGPASASLSLVEAKLLTRTKTVDYNPVDPIPAIMPCITHSKKTLQFAQLAIGSTTGSIYSKADI
jgi:hypothetical protein